MLGSGRFSHKQVDSFLKIIRSTVIIRHCKAVLQPEGNVPLPSEKVIIPPRIERGPTDILKALASTVYEDFTAFEYKYPDDPFFYSYSPFYKKVLALAIESGKKSAKWVVENNPAFFKHQLSEPPIQAFLPKPVDNSKLELTEETLISAIEQRDTVEAIRIFKALQIKNLEISKCTKQCLLELVCFYNCEPKSNEELETKWFSNPQLSTNHMNTWKNKEFAEELFDKMDPGCSLANSAIIQGMFKYNEIFKACALFEKAGVNKIKLSVGAYNAYLSNSHILAGKIPFVVFIKQVLQEMSQKKIIPNLGTLNATLKSLEKSTNVGDKPRVAMQILGEFENLEIEPSLGSYGIFFSIVGRANHHERFYWPLVENIMDFIGQKKHEILHKSDLDFFLNSMLAFYEKNSNLVMKLHEMLLRNNNTKFIVRDFDQNLYYQKLYIHVFTKKSLDFAMETLRKHFVIVSPTVGTFKIILQAISGSYSSEYFLKIWEYLKKVNFIKNRAMLRQVICYVEHCVDETSLKIVHQAAINFLERISSEDLLIEEKMYISCILKALAKNDDEKRLLSVLEKFEVGLQLLNVDKTAWKIVFDYAMSKKNVKLIRSVLALASAAKYSDTEKMVEEALPMLNVEDAAWACKLIEEKTKV